MIVPAFLQQEHDGGMKTYIFVILLSFAALAFWGCPTKKYIPDPTPPAPQVQKAPDQVRNFYEELLSLEGRAPPAGMRIEFKRMVADKQIVYLTVPL